VTKYEILLLLDPEVDESRQAEIVGRMREQVEKGGGSWDLHDPWGRRRLAYEIGHKTDGTYHLIQFTSDAATLDEISRVLRIDDDVMRHMATRRIEGSPARPVAVSAPARQDEAAQHEETQDGEKENERPRAPAAQDGDAGDDAVAEEPVEAAISTEVEEEG
jgi:small subunit ribosomal protein S6